MKKLQLIQSFILKYFTSFNLGVPFERHDKNFRYRYVLVPQLHCKDKPAIEYPNNGTKCWFLYNKRHRTDGPAIDFGNPELDRYFIKGKELTKKEYENRDRSKDNFNED